MTSLLIVLLTLITAVLPAYAQTPAISPDCDIAGIVAEVQDRLNEIDIQDAESALLEIELLTLRMDYLKALCRGLVFEGTDADVLGPVEIPEGIYRVHALPTQGYFGVEVAVMRGECGEGQRANGTLLFNEAIDRDETPPELESLFVSTGCIALLIVDADAPYTITFESIGQ
jgi:hypothetical protein